MTPASGKTVEHSRKYYNKLKLCKASYSYSNSIEITGQIDKIYIYKGQIDKNDFSIKSMSNLATILSPEIIVLNVYTLNKHKFTNLTF